MSLRRLGSYGVLIFFAVVCLGSASTALAAGVFAFDSSRALGYKYILTDPVGYFDMHNIGDANDTIIGVKIIPIIPGDQTFRVVHTFDSIAVPPGKFTPIGVVMDLRDTVVHTTLVQITSTGSNPVIQDTLSVQGCKVYVHTALENRSGHAFEYFSIPITVTSFTDTLHQAVVQRYSCFVTYDPTLLTIDTAALTVGVDTQGVSHGFSFHIDSPFVAGKVQIHAVGVSTNGIQNVGDVVFKLTFQANQFLFTSTTGITTTFTADTGFLYVQFSSDSSIFTTLPCLYPTKVIQATDANFVDNHPNPFNPSTIIRFHMDNTSYAQVAVYDRIGRLVKILADGLIAAGDNNLEFDGTDLPSGIYFCRLNTLISTDTRMITLTR